MEIRLMIQSTPNPNALKFVLNIPVKTEGNVTYKSADDCGDNPMAKAIFGVNPEIKEVYFFDNYITVTQNGAADWDALEEKIRETILANASGHQADFKVEEKSQSRPVSAPMTPEVEKINTILDETVRPALQMDGGDIQVIEYTDNVVRVFYQGACGSCPSSSMGTMKAIENILRDQFNPDITVELAESL